MGKPGLNGSYNAELTAKLLSGRKYRGLNIPPATLDDLIARARETSSDSKVIEHLVREKLHNLVAVYLGDPDYPSTQILLEAAFANGNSASVKEVCRDILASHASTKERLPILNEFYAKIFSVTGIPNILLDLACGLNPFALPWMGLKLGCRYYACDLHQPRVDLINRFFELSGMEPLAFHQDILVNPPDIDCDMAFFFKEAHRFEQRRRGCNRAFWQAIKCRTLLVSLPTTNLTGKHPKLEQHRRLVMDTIDGLPWKVSEIVFSNEIVFCIEK